MRAVSDYKFWCQVKVKRHVTFVRQLGIYTPPAVQSALCGYMTNVCLCALVRAEVYVCILRDPHPPLRRPRGRAFTAPYQLPGRVGPTPSTRAAALPLQGGWGHHLCALRLADWDSRGVALTAIDGSVLTVSSHCPHSVLTVSSQCPHSVLTVSSQCPHSVLTVFVKCATVDHSHATLRSGCPRSCR